MLIESNSKYYFINNSGAKKTWLVLCKKRGKPRFFIFF